MLPGGRQEGLRALLDLNIDLGGGKVNAAEAVVTFSLGSCWLDVAAYVPVGSSAGSRACFGWRRALFSHAILAAWAPTETETIPSACWRV